MLLRRIFSGKRRSLPRTHFKIILKENFEISSLVEDFDLALEPWAMRAASLKSSVRIKFFYFDIAIVAQAQAVHNSAAKRHKIHQFYCFVKAC